MNIDNIFSMLDERNTKDEQAEGIKYAKEIKSLSVFFQPTEGKVLWHNCAVVIAERCDEELEPYLFGMFEWLQDMNWPGADVIYNRLLKFKREKIELMYDICLKEARSRNDAAWEGSLICFWKTYGCNTEKIK